jgi:predicted HTH transcriptional regulator
MKQIWIFIIGAGLGAVATLLALKKNKPSVRDKSSARQGGGPKKGKGDSIIEKQAKEKAEHKRKILEFIKGKEKIYNNDIEKLLKVSNATAERYLNELEKEGILKQIGKIGQGVCYEVIVQIAEQIIEEVVE